MNRLGLFIFNDKRGIVDKTVTLLLEEMKKYTTETIVVCKGGLTSDSRQLLKKYSKKIIVRKYEDFDFYATREGLEYIGWNNIKKYDEVVIYNSTIGGPVFSFEEMFVEMEKRVVDFWGITKYYSKRNSYLKKYITYAEQPDYIQTYFYAIRKKMLQSYEFKKHWYPKTEPKNLYEAAGIHDAVFTKKFNEYGFVSDVYIDTEKYRLVTENPILWIPDILINNFRCPIFLKESILSNNYESSIKNTQGKTGRELLQVLKKRGYDIECLADFIIKNDYLYDINKKYNLKKVFSTEEKRGGDVERNILLILNVKDVTLFKLLKDRIFGLSDVLDVCLITYEQNELFEEYKKSGNLKVLLFNTEDIDIESEINKCLGEYEYIGYSVLQQNMGYQFMLTELEKNRYMLDNMMYNKVYLDNIFEFLDNSPKLYGVLPFAYSRGFENKIIDNIWTNNFAFIDKLADRLGHKALISKPTIEYAEGWFWCKKDIFVDYINCIKEKFCDECIEIHKKGLIAILFSIYCQNRGLYNIYSITEENLIDEYSSIKYYFEKIAFKDIQDSYWKVIDKYK